MAQSLFHVLWQTSSGEGAALEVVPFVHCAHLPWANIIFSEEFQNATGYPVTSGVKGRPGWEEGKGSFANCCKKRDMSFSPPYLNRPLCQPARPSRAVFLNICPLLYHFRLSTYLFKVPVELTGSKIIASYFWTERPNVKQQIPVRGSKWMTAFLKVSVIQASYCWVVCLVPGWQGSRVFTSTTKHFKYHWWYPYH